MKNPLAASSETPTRGQRLFAEWHNYLKENQTLPASAAQIQSLATFQDRLWPLDIETGRPIDPGTPDNPQSMVLVRGSNHYYQIYSLESWTKYLVEFRRDDSSLVPDPLKNSMYINYGYGEGALLITACEFLRLGFRPTQAQWDDIANHQPEKATVFKPPIPATEAALDVQRTKCHKARLEYIQARSTLDSNHRGYRNIFDYYYALEIRNQFPLAVAADPEDIREPQIGDHNYQEADYYLTLLKFNSAINLDRIVAQQAAKKLIALEKAEMRLAIMEARPAPMISQASPQESIKTPQEIKQQIDKIYKEMVKNLDKAYKEPIDQAAVSSAIKYGRALAKEAAAKPVTPVEAIACMRAYMNVLAPCKLR